MSDHRLNAGNGGKSKFLKTSPRCKDVVGVHHDDEKCESSCDHQNTSQPERSNRSRVVRRSNQVERKALGWMGLSPWDEKHRVCGSRPGAARRCHSFSLLELASLSTWFFKVIAIPRLHSRTTSLCCEPLRTTSIPTVCLSAQKLTLYNSCNLNSPQITLNSAHHGEQGFSNSSPKSC